MNYLAQRIIMLIFCAVGALSLMVGVISLAVPLIRGTSFIPVLDSSILALLFGTIFFFVGVSRYRKFTRFAKQTYDWYKQQYPELLTDQGARCYSCKSSSVRVRGLMNHTYTREHFCARCGATLYYSPENTSHIIRKPKSQIKKL